MINKVNSYIHNLDKVKTDDIDLIGVRSYNLAQFFHKKINHPSVVSITSIAFDDFLIASNIAQPIINILSTVRPYDYQSAKNASEQIANHIFSATIPDIIIHSILEAYSLILKSSRSKYVELGVSEIISPEYLPDSHFEFKPVEIVNEQQLVDQVKYAWFSLFSPEAIEKRANTYYKGPLSISLYLKNIIRAELTGKVFSIPPVTHEDDTLEIWAMFGSPGENVTMELSADMYKFNISSKKIIQKNFIPQTQMIVRKAKLTPNQDPFMKVNVSNEWQRQQKISDSQIEEIAKTAIELEKKLEKPIEISWGTESGELYITDISDLFLPTELEIPAIEKEKEFLKNFNVEVFDDNHDEVTKLSDPDLDDIEYEIERMVDSGDLSIENDDAGKNKLKLVSAKSKRRLEEYPEWMKRYDLNTDLFIDVSNLDMISLNAVDLFDGSFLDGTELVLKNNELPEKDTDKSQEKIINNFAAEIAIAAKDSEGEPLIYSFSNILEYEYKLLNYNPKDYGYLGDERFIEHPKALAIEVQAIKMAKDEYKKDNISILFPYVRNTKNLEDLKSIVSSQGLRRSKNTKFYAEIAIPSFVHELEIIPDGVVDGFVINYDTLLKLLVYRNEIRRVDHDVVLRLISKIVKICKKLNYEYLFKVSELDEEVLKELIKFKPNALLLNELPDEELIKELVKQEGNSQKSAKKTRSTFLHTRLG